jgi:putative DNA primase/helicase
VSEEVQGHDLGTSYLTPEEDARRSELCQAAIAYARRGFAVIPVRWMDGDDCSCRAGAECPSKGKHPVHDAWPDKATTEPLEAAHWWRPAPQEPNPSEWWPQANIGIVTGRRSGIWVLDVDLGKPDGGEPDPDGGDVTLARYEARYGSLPETRIHHTGSGGVHYFWRHPGFDVRNNAKTVLGKGLDLRGERGFVVAPPSVSAKGVYELNPVQDIDPADAPGWLTELLRDYDKEQNGEALAGKMPEAGGAVSRRYAEAAVHSEASRMRKAPPGVRNSTLNECAFSLGTLGGAGLLEESVAYDALREAAADAGLGEGETRATFTSGWKAGLGSPRQVPWSTAQGEWPTRARTEFGLADRMVDHCGESLKWVPEWATWATYQHGVWVRDETATGERYAQMMIRALPETEAFSYEEEPGEAPDGTELPSPRRGFEDWVAKQQTKRAVSAAARLALALPAMRMSQNALDLDPMLLNCRNGVVDLSTGELLRHSPDHRMTLQAAAVYRPGEEAPLWEEFLRRVQPDPEMRAYIQRVAGYCATGRTDEQAMFLWHGAGANGKSVAQAVIAHALGTYSQTLPVSTLMASTMDDRIPNDVARMKGRRFLVASETKQGKALDEQRMKALTGGDTISARFMRAEWFDFKPEGKIQLTTNHLPRMSDDAATWRRIHLIVWPVTIPEHERDGFLQERLIAEELPGILAWIAQGCLAWQAEGLAPPDGVLRAKESYRVEEDIVQQFIEAMLDVVPSVNRAAGRSTAEIFAAFEFWAQGERLGKSEMLPRKAFTARLRKHGFEYVRSGGWTGFPGLQVRPAAG